MSDVRYGAHGPILTGAGTTISQTPTGWKCPNCNSAHGPHVDTCPQPSMGPLGHVPLMACSCGIVGAICKKIDCVSPLRNVALSGQTVVAGSGND